MQFKYLKNKEKDEDYLFGTYDSWNMKRSMYYQARAINDYIISLIECGYYNLAKKCYEIIGENEFKNKYFKNHIMIMKQNMNDDH